MRRTPIVLTLGALLAGGCGGGGHAGGSTRPHPRPAAERVCSAASHRAAVVSGHPAPARITSRDPLDVRCQVSVQGGRLAVEAQASTQAWMEFDTTQVHLIQGYPPGTAAYKAHYPQPVRAPTGVQANWVPAQRQVFATNGSQSRGGSYVTVTVSGRLTAARGRALARAVTLATLGVAPRGPAPGG